MAAPKRSKMIGVRVRPREMAVVQTAANLEGVTVAEFVRDRLLPEARSVVSGKDQPEKRHREQV